MTLRARLILISVAVALPLVAIMYAVDERLRIKDMEGRLQQFAAAELASGVAARCIDNDGAFRPPGSDAGRPPRDDGRPPRDENRPPRDDGSRPPRDRRPPPPPSRRLGQPPYELMAYHANFEPALVSQGAMDAALQAQLRRADIDSATAPFSSREGRGVQMAMWLDRTSTGPCAILVLQMRPRSGERRDQLLALSLITLVWVMATWLAAGPVITRLRRLAEAVHRSADTRYQEPVPETGGDEVAALAREFNIAGTRVREQFDELQSREDGLRRFVANTAHDVGLPLTVLQGHLAALADKLAPADVRNLHSAMQEAHYLGSLIRNLNAATRLDASETPLARHEVDLSALVERVVARHQPLARASQVELNSAVPEAPVTVLAEVTLLEQALSNLVDNAIRYNRAGGHVAVVLDLSGDAFTLAVEDDGPGVGAADISRLTDRWYRSDEARTRRPDGQGLGLAIAAESIKRLGLSLTFSQPSAGGLRAEIRTL